VDKNHLGEYRLDLKLFSGLEALLKEGKLSGSEFERSHQVSALLAQLIDREAGPCFLLRAVLDFIDRVVEKKILEAYTLSHFELWLNQFSGFEREQNLRIRGKVMGKAVPRDEYQVLFPIGMEKTHPGSHIVTAHQSPDLDTTVASFWGWVDAFAARVSEGLHLWNVPGGPPASQVEIGILFDGIFGKGIFPHIAKTRSTLSLSSLELLTQNRLVRKRSDESSFSPTDERVEQAVIVVDEEGNTKGEWRAYDIEGVGQIIFMLNQALRWFASHVQMGLIGFFSHKEPTAKGLTPLVRSMLEMRIDHYEPAQEMSAQQKKNLNAYLSRVLGVSKGIESTIVEFAHAMKGRDLAGFAHFVDQLHALEKAPLFDGKGHSSAIFLALQEIIKSLNSAIQGIRRYVERLEVALQIKTEVFKESFVPLSPRAEIEEIRSKMGTSPYLIVTQTDRHGNEAPLGVIYASDVYKPILGTVTVRDFCNREETKIPAYFEVISAIDHHKSSVATTAPSTFRLSDAQSSNTLVAEAAFEINDRYSTGGMTTEEIDRQAKSAMRDTSSPVTKRVIQRLMRKQLAAERRSPFFIDSHREYVEYLHFFYAILDDTDLLTKVSFRDVKIVCCLLNRMKSLMSRQEVETVSFDDIPRDAAFVEKAAARILQNSDAYSLYRKIYHAKEEAVEQSIQLAAKGKPSTLFADTKEQNGCARVGQTKMFAKNFPTYEKHAMEIRKEWMKNAQTVAGARKEIDLHLHMISTVAGSEDLFAGTLRDYAHKDELWIWIPDTEQAIGHLKAFLSGLRTSPQIAKNHLEVEFYGENAKQLDQIFSESFLPITRRLPTHTEQSFSLPFAILRFKAGLMNSRKAMISPYLPKG
jgi:hypothetical protein